MLKSILDLDDVEVYDVMNHRRNLFALNVDMPVKKMVDKVKNSPFSRIPLYQDKPENIVGVIRVKHLLKECVDKKNDFSKIDVRKLMSAPWFIPENTTLLQQLQMFRKRREHFALLSTNTVPCKALSRWKTFLRKSSVTSTTKPTFRISIPWAFAKRRKQLAGRRTGSHPRHQPQIRLEYRRRMRRYRCRLPAGDDTVDSRTGTKIRLRRPVV